MHERMEDRRMVKLDQIRSFMIGNDIPGDWVTIGILASSLKTQKSKEKQNFGVIRLYDMNETTVNLLLSTAVIDKFGNEPASTVVALLNPIIVLPNEVFNKY